MAARTGERGRVVPVRDMERERAASAPSDVKTWKMSPEELEDYRARTGYKQPRNQDGERISPPIQVGSKNQIKEAEENMRTTKEPDKQKFLELTPRGRPSRQRNGNSD